MVQNVVLNNSDVNFSSQWDQVRASQDAPKVVATAGSNAEIVATQRAQLESSTLAGGTRVDNVLRDMGTGVNRDHNA